MNKYELAEAIEAWDSDGSMEYDPFESFRPSRRRKQRTSLSPNRRHKSAMPVLKVTGLKRPLDTKSKQQLYGVAETALPESADLISRKKLGGSILTGARALALYRSFLPAIEPNERVEQFNSRIGKLRHDINVANPALYPKIGEVGIFGDIKRGYGPLFVGVNLVGEDAQKLANENREANTRLASNRLEPNFAPHVSLVSVSSFEEAADYTDRISEGLQAYGLGGTAIKLQKSRPIEIFVR